jgi:hypothetical protein
MLKHRLGMRHCLDIISSAFDDWPGIHSPNLKD